MQRRKLITYGAMASSALALTLFVGWWQVDGPGAPETSREASSAVDPDGLSDDQSGPRDCRT